MAKKKKVKVAFPHLGTISIAWAAGLKKVGVEPYIPPYTSKKTLSFGTKNFRWERTYAIPYVWD